MPSPSIYYNEHDAKAAAWLRELMAAGLIPEGHVDERSILEVRPSDLAGFVSCHFFAGIGGWPYALRLAGWPDERPVWTGSCPCQPFSVAGKGLGNTDERHLWPAFFNLIRECRPERVFGEQVASAIGHGWLDGICTDLGAEGYTCGSSVLGAHSVGAPHIRQRLFWMAYAEFGGREGRAVSDSGEKASVSSENSLPSRLDDATDSRRAGSDGREQRRAEPNGRCASSDQWLEHPIEQGLEGHAGHVDDRGEPGRVDPLPSRPAPSAGGLGHWADFDLVHCTDGKARRIEPGTFPLAHGVPGRVGLLRGYGNAIDPILAAEFIQACEEVIGEMK